MKNLQNNQKSNATPMGYDTLLATGTDEILKLTQEISTWTYLAETLTQEHQQSVRSEIMAKVRNMQLQLKELRSACC